MFSVWIHTVITLSAGFIPRETSYHCVQWVRREWIVQPSVTSTQQHFPLQIKQAADPRRETDLSGRGLQSGEGSSAEAEENVFALIHTAIEASAIHLSHYLHYCENVFLSNSFLRTQQYPFHILCRFPPGGSYEIKNLSAAPPQAWLWCCQRAEALHRRLV